MGVKLQSSSGGSVDITAPVTASNYVLTAPAANGTILNDASSLAAAMLTGNVDVARLVSAFSGSNVSLSSSGYQKLPSGLIIQWGYFVPNTDGNYTVTFPITFPTACVAVSPGGLPSAYTNNYWWQAYSITTANFNANRVDGLGFGSTVGATYMAIGY